MDLKVKSCYKHIYSYSKRKKIKKGSLIKGPFYLILFLNKNELQSNFLAEINVLTGKKDVLGIEEQIIERLKIEGREEGLEQGLEQGREQGLQEGIAIGIEKGLERGLEKGKTEELVKAISNMTKRGFSDQDIIEILDISQDKLNKLRM